MKAIQPLVQLPHSYIDLSGSLSGETVPLRGPKVLSNDFRKTPKKSWTLVMR